MRELAVYTGFNPWRYCLRYTFYGDKMTKDTTTDQAVEWLETIMDDFDIERGASYKTLIQAAEESQELRAEAKKWFLNSELLDGNMLKYRDQAQELRQRVKVLEGVRDILINIQSQTHQPGLLKLTQDGLAIIRGICGGGAS